MKALLVDDHPIFRGSLRTLLADVLSLDVFEASNGPEAIEIQKREHPEFIAQKLELPNENGMQLLRRLIREDRDVKILMLSVEGYSAYAGRCFQYGAKGYMSLNASPQEMKIAVGEVIGGGSYIEAQISIMLEKSHGDQNDALTQHEIDLLRRLAKGQSFDEIAANWGVSYKTVSGTAKKVRIQLNLPSAAALIHFAIQLYDKRSSSCRRITRRP